MVSLENAWKKSAPNIPFKYNFLDEDFKQLYSDLENLGTTMKYFTLVAAFIACLGLFGLASFTAEQKTKEIGIRRILGASVPAMVVLLVRLFLRWLLFSSLIACPIAYYAMSRWMSNFAYRAEVQIWIFLLAPALTAVVALSTVGLSRLGQSRRLPAL